MSVPAYQAPTKPRPVALYLPPDAHPTSTAEEVDALRLALPGWLWPGERWAAWRYQWDDQRGDWRKVPLDPLSFGRYARANDPHSWAALEDAVAFRRRYGADGISRALVDGEGVLAIDLDHVRDPISGELDALARDTLGRLAGYVEVSASGTGLHLLTREPFPEPGKRGRRRGQVEVYSGGRFIGITARVVRRGR